MEQNNDNNHLYTLIKHCNEFLYRRDDYRIPSDSQSDHSNNENILKTMNDEVFNRYSKNTPKVMIQSTFGVFL